MKMPMFWNMNTIDTFATKALTTEVRENVGVVNIGAEGNLIAIANSDAVPTTGIKMMGNFLAAQAAGITRWGKFRLVVTEGPQAVELGKQLLKAMSDQRILDDKAWVHHTLTSPQVEQVLTIQIHHRKHTIKDVQGRAVKHWEILYSEEKLHIHAVLDDGGVAELEIKDLVRSGRVVFTNLRVPGYVHCINTFMLKNKIFVVSGTLGGVYVGEELIEETKLYNINAVGRNPKTGTITCVNADALIRFGGAADGIMIDAIFQALPSQVPLTIHWVSEKEIELRWIDKGHYNQVYLSLPKLPVEHFATAS